MYLHLSPLSPETCALHVFRPVEERKPLTRRDIGRVVDVPRERGYTRCYYPITRKSVARVLMKMHKKYGMVYCGEYKGSLVFCKDFTADEKSSEEP